MHWPEDGDLILWGSVMVSLCCCSTETVCVLALMFLSDANVFGNDVIDGRETSDCSMALRRRVTASFLFHLNPRFVWWHPRCTVLGRGKIECRPECPLLVLPDLLRAVSAPSLYEVSTTSFFLSSIVRVDRDDYAQIMCAVSLRVIRC